MLSSLMFHHLSLEDKERTLRAARRVLKPGGEFHMVDFVGAQDVHGFLNRLLHSRERLKDNSERRIGDLIRQAGFADLEIPGHRAMLFGLGRVAYYKAAASKAAAAGSGR